MTTMSMQAATAWIESLSSPATSSTSIDAYLSQMLMDYEAGESPCLFLPSLIDLSACFSCSAVDVHNALLSLKENGCDFFIMGFESPITVWYPNRLLSS